MSDNLNDETRKQIADDVHDRFHRGTPYSSKDFEGMSDDEHRHVTAYTGNLQRWNGMAHGSAEGAVFSPHGLYKKLGGGLYPWTAEHTGDLYWRTNKGRNSGISDMEEVASKAAKVHSVLTQPYGFEREMKENLTANSQLSEHPHASWDTAVVLGKHYADEHSKLPVYHLPAELMGQATKHLGNMRFGAAAAVLSNIKGMTADEDQWEYAHSRQGNIDYLKSIGR